MALLRAARISQARGFAGVLSRGHCTSAASRAAASASSARSMSPRIRISVARIRPRSCLKTLSIVSRLEDTAPELSPGAGMMMPSACEHPDRPHLDRAALRGGDPRGDLGRLVQILRLDQVVAAQLLLHLRERPVRGQRLAITNADARRRRGRLER